MTKKYRARLSDFAQKFFMLSGENFSLKGRDHLLLPYNHNKKKTLFMFSRQAEKSTTLAAKSIARSCLFPHFKSLYVAPRDLQVRVFSSQKLNEFIYESPLVKQRFQNKKSTASVSYKTFSNGSDYTLRSAFLSADSTRGISADALYIDEFQDIMRDHIPVIESCLQHGKEWARFREYCGTPKSLKNPMEVEWQKSLQIEWIIKCRGCNKHNKLGMKNIGKFHLICSKCGKQIYSEDGGWQVTNKNGDFPGFRICYLMVPWVCWNNPNDKSEAGVIQMLNDWPESKFLNETLAISTDNSETPFTEAMMRNACSDYKMLPHLDDSILRKIGALQGQVTAGVDWGTSEENKSRTVLTIGVRCNDGRFKILFMKRFRRSEYDPEQEVDKIAQYCRQFGVSKIGVDFGFGYIQNFRLKQKFQDKVVELYNSASSQAFLAFNQKTMNMIVSRTLAFSRLQIDILDRNITFFNWSSEVEEEGFEYYVQDFLNVYCEYNESTRKLSFDHTGTDDAVHSINYAYCANMILNKNYAVINGSE